MPPPKSPTQTPETKKEQETPVSNNKGGLEGKPTEEEILEENVTTTRPIPPGQMAAELRYPSVAPPGYATHFSGRYKARAKYDKSGKYIGCSLGSWTNYPTPLTWDQLPHNAKDTFLKPGYQDHWANRTFHLGGNKYQVSEDGREYWKVTKEQDPATDTNVVPDDPKSHPQRGTRFDQQEGTGQKSQIRYEPINLPTPHDDKQGITAPEVHSHSIQRDPLPPFQSDISSIKRNNESQQKYFQQPRNPRYAQPDYVPFVSVKNYDEYADRDFVIQERNVRGWEYEGKSPQQRRNEEYIRMEALQKEAMNAQRNGTEIRTSSSDEGIGSNGSNFRSNTTAPHSTSKGHQSPEGHHSGSGGMPPNGPGYNAGGFPLGPTPTGRFGGNGGMPTGGGGGGPPPSGNPYTHTTSNDSMVKPLMKPDIKSFPILKVMAEFTKWYSDSLALAKAQGVACLFDHTYKPRSSYDKDIFYFQQAFFYAVLRRVIKPPELWQFVNFYLPTTDAQAALISITNHARKSTHAIITLRDSMQDIVNARMVKDWKGTALDFIIAFDAMMDEYNKCQEHPELHINSFQKRQYLQNAVTGVRGLQDVLDRESDRITMGEPAFNYEQYMSTLKSVATRLDDKRRKEGKRFANWHSLEDNLPNSSQIDVNQAEVKRLEYAINEARQKRDSSDYAAQMNRETWKSLSPETQAVWDTISKEEKAKILTYSKDRSNRRSTKAHLTDTNTKIDVNNHDISSDDRDDEGPHEEPATTSEGVKVNTVMWKANNAILDARNEAHPGDPRRMMGSSQGARASIEAKLHQHLRSFDDSHDEESSDEEESSDFS
jgi:hypothetical protein